jgi:hypothetical protein
VDPAELLAYLAAALARLGLRYFVTGSVATVFYGEPRFTNDIDVVVELLPARAAPLVAAFPPPDFYLDLEAAERAARNHGMFNVIHPRSGLKIDFNVSDGGAFDRSRFERARPVRVGAGVEVSFASPEDVVVKKLQFHRAGGSEKHLRDVAGVLRVSGADLDRDYIASWAERLEVTDLWLEVQRRAGAD